MWRSYWVIALRSLAKHPLFASINLIGLAVGMAACLGIALWVQHERTYDHWLPEIERLFMVQSQVQYPARPGERWSPSQMVMLPLYQTDYAGDIDAATRVMPASRAVRRGERVEAELMALVDADFFKVFQFPVVAGSTAAAFTAPNHIVITEKFASKWFGNQDAVNQALTITVKGERQEFVVQAVLRDLPSNTTINFQALMLLDPKHLPPDLLTNWGAFSGGSIVKLKDASRATALNAAADAFIAKHAPSFLTVDQGFYYRPVLHPLADAHLGSPAKNGLFKPAGEPHFVAAVALTGLGILIIAVMTYVNLATARLSLRAREVGLRKTMGATRGQLVAQFLVESTVLALLAGVIALAMVEVLLPLLNLNLGLKLQLSYWGQSGALLPLAVLVLLVGLAGGWYPALVLSRLAPRAALQGEAARGGSWLRQALVISQFAVAVTLIACVTVIYLQIQHMRHTDLGYQATGMLIVGSMQRAEVKPRQEAFMQAAARLPNVVATTRAVFDPGGPGLMRRRALLPGVPDAQAPQITQNPVDWDYVKTYGARLIAGRDLSVAYANDNWSGLDSDALVKRGGNVLISRAAVKLFNVTQPQAAIGKTFQLEDDTGRVTVTIVGVLDDIYIRSPRDTAEPAMFTRDTDNASSVTLRYTGIAPNEFRASIEKLWREMFPDSPFSATLVEDAVESFYKREVNQGKLMAVCALLAIVLCAAGLYGLAAFTAERRTKEIGIRKVLGAEVGDLVRLLLWQFSKPVLFGTVAAAPLALWLMSEWLSGFATRLALSPWPFIAAGLLALLIAAATVSGHAYNAARQSPVIALRRE